MKLFHVVIYVACFHSSALVLRNQHDSSPQSDGHTVAEDNVNFDQQKASIRDFTSPMRATPQGICMYDLPAHFNLGLLNSTFKQPVPQPMNISPLTEPPLQGMFDTNQFALERIFYDRMQLAATTTLPPNECVMFYVPYFVAWETSAANGVWITPHRPELDKELMTHLTHFSSIGLAGRNHFIVVGRISLNAMGFINNGVFRHMVKLVLEDTDPGNLPNVFAVPYPTWFRYYPGLEPSAESLSQLPSIKVVSATVNVNGGSPCLTLLGDIQSRLRIACDGRPSCSFLLIAVPGINSSAVASSLANCPALDVHGTYSCNNGPPLNFKTVPQETALGHALFLSCYKGPCWLWGACDHPGLAAATGISARTGPLATIIGSARPKEYERRILFSMCDQRPQLCAKFDTGQRENSSSFVHSRIPDMYQMLMASTFCINPPGDTPTRKGLFDSMVLGCIPVVTSEDSMQQYRFHLPFWRSISILVTTDKLFAEGFNLFDYLAEYKRNNPREVWQKQESLRKAAYSLQYSLQPATTVLRGSDAFDKVLEHMLSRPMSGNQQDFTETYQLVNAYSNRMLFASAGPVDYQQGFGASTHEKPVATEHVWQIMGRGDGSCCYRIVNIASRRALYAQSNSSDTTNIGAAKLSEPDWADQRWRFTAEGDGTFTISNVASGRRLYASVGQEDAAGFGATLTAASFPAQRWKIVAKPKWKKLAT